VNGRKVIGFDREIRLEWLDAVAARVAAGDSPQETRAWLDDYLHDVVGGEGRSGNRGKTITVLCRIWSNVPGPSRSLRDRALATLESVTSQERVAVHWALATSVYPFFGDVVSVVGRLLALQGDVERHAVLKRLTDSWGDRPAVSRAGRAIWSSLIHWGVMQETNRRGRYRQLERKHLVSTKVTRLLIEAIVQSTGRQSISLSAMSSWSGLFPFKLRDPSRSLADSTEVFVTHHGGVPEVLRRNATRQSVHDPS